MASELVSGALGIGGSMDGKGKERKGSGVGSEALGELGNE